MCGRFDASADAGATTCHDEDIIQMFPAQQTACGKEKKKYGYRYANISKIVLHIGYVHMFD